jgi:4-hydroxy-tetrahydrodipicolinate reductase
MKFVFTMKLLLLGRGKMGTLVDEIARARAHTVRIIDIDENLHGAALTPEKLRDIDAVIDFTTPHAVMENIEGCIRSGKNLVVGTTGWYEEIPKIRQMVEKAGTGFLFASNFSVGVNLFFEIAKTASTALRLDYSGRISECHHVHKKDAPSGTAVILGKVVQDASGAELPISSSREGEVVGTHELVLESPNDTITLRHDAKSRRGFAEGAVRAAEWLRDKKGFYDFRDIWREL